MFIKQKPSSLFKTSIIAMGDIHQQYAWGFLIINLLLVIVQVKDVLNLTEVRFVLIEQRNQTELSQIADYDVLKKKDYVDEMHVYMTEK